MVKATAASEGVTLREFVVGVLERDMKRGGWTAGKAVKTPVAEPDVSMDALRGIGNVAAVREVPAVAAKEMCGHRELNPLDGEMYVCRLPKHPKKVPHQPGEKVQG
jgi:hypothetical protein